MSPAIAMNDTLLEGTLIAGPMLAAALAVIAPTAAIGALALALAVAAAALPRSTSPSSPPIRQRCSSLLRHPGMILWLAAATGTGVLFGSLDAGALGIAHHLHGGPATAALILTLISGASVLAGIAYTALGHRLRNDPLRRASWLLIVPAFAVIAVAVSDSWLVSGPALAGLGLCTAPLITTQSLGAETVFPASRRLEGFTLIATAGSAGYAVGSLSIAGLPLPVAELASASLALATALLMVKSAIPRQ